MAGLVPSSLNKLATPLRPPSDPAAPYCNTAILGHIIEIPKGALTESLGLLLNSVDQALHTHDKSAVLNICLTGSRLESISAAESTC